MKFAKILACNVAVLLALLAAFDIVGYFVIPANWNFHGYKSRFSWQRGFEGSFYPRGYFEENATRGFDIRPAPHGISVNTSYFHPIEANELGCRDRRVSFDPKKPLIYAAGDSQTWGFIPTDARWTNLLEKKIDIPVLNCGVPNTAQYHQHAKYRQVIGLLKRRPDLVLVAYVDNDVFEDSRFPMVTVVNGVIAYNNGSRSEIKARVENEIARLDNPPLLERFTGDVKRYSLSAQIVGALWKRETAPPINSEYDYSDALAGPNKRAIEEFGEDVCSNGSRFAVLVLPDARHLQFPDYFAGLDEFLRRKGIFAIDFHRLASRQGLRYSDFAQANDPHFSEVGNLHFANEVYDAMEKDGETFGSCEHLSGPAGAAAEPSGEAVRLVR